MTSRTRSGPAPPTRSCSPATSTRRSARTRARTAGAVHHAGAVRRVPPGDGPGPGACHEAQALAGDDDPSPYIAEISCALSLGYGHEDFRALWAEVEKRAPHHLAAHAAALQYWCRKWRGSHELAEEFARRAAAKGSPGQLLSLLPLYAAFEQETTEEEADTDAFHKTPELVAAADACLTDLAAAVAADPADPWIVRVRHLLAWTLY
ncbi:hypothetical protein [Streptomyces sp. SM11]|uniref:hypothetical protein n=1 Tax=Streptomyces sp. SM11 TaxID=565557 RepID=UPI000CD512A9|nr:hypothetical protein [Streptomyces sp. SM11]